MLTLAVVSPTAVSRDVTAFLASIVNEAWDELFVVYDTSSCPAIARNRGWQACHTDLVAFIDDDVIVDPGSLARGVRHFEADPDLVLGQAAVRGGFVTDPTFMFLTTCMFVRRYWLKATGGFHMGFGYAKPEADLEFGWRTLDEGGKVAFMEDVTVDHPDPSGSSWSEANILLMKELHEERWTRMTETESSWA